MNTNRQAAQIATMYGTYLNAPGPGRLNPSLLKPNFIRNMVAGYQKYGCKFLFGRLSVNINTLSGLQQSQSVSPLQIQVIQAKIAFIKDLITRYRCQESGTGGGPTIPCDKVPKMYCDKFTLYSQTGDTAGIAMLISNLAQQLGTTKNVAADLLKRCCRRPSGGGDDSILPNISCERLPQGVCQKFLYETQINNIAGVNAIISSVATMLGISKNDAGALLKRCCRPHSPIIDDGTTTTTATDDCRITCYKCVNGSPVANKFDPIKQSKADGSGYIYNCPSGWGIIPNPCKTPVNGSSNGNNTLVPEIPIRDTGFTNTTTTFPVRPTGAVNTFGQTVSPVKTGSGVGVSTTNPGLTSGSNVKTGPYSGTQTVSTSNYATPLRFSGGTWMNNDY